MTSSSATRVPLQQRCLRVRYSARSTVGDWPQPVALLIGLRRLALTSWFTPIGLRRLARLDCLLFHDCFLCFRSPSPIHLDPSPRLLAPCLKPAPNPRRARGLLMGIRPRRPITQLTLRMKRAQDSSSRRATGPSAIATEPGATGYAEGP
jgi:hypothetical protein